MPGGGIPGIPGGALLDPGGMGMPGGIGIPGGGADPGGGMGIPGGKKPKSLVSFG